MAPIRFIILIMRFMRLCMFVVLMIDIFSIWHVAMSLEFHWQLSNWVEPLSVIFSNWVSLLSNSQNYTTSTWWIWRFFFHIFLWHRRWIRTIFTIIFHFFRIFTIVSIVWVCFTKISKSTFFWNFWISSTQADMSL